MEDRSTAIFKEKSTLGECYHWVYYSRDSTRECHGYLTLGEAVRKLDFSNAVEDTKRFRYVCRLLHLLLGEKMTELAGSAQKNLFSILEKIVNRVIESQIDIGPIHELLTMAAKSCGRSAGTTSATARPCGSSAWRLCSG
ncbi:F-box only protein 32 [Branchiostoma belcheri]|nr:F-box only protein 32 [Branchiostoma belcheri]